MKPYYVMLRFNGPYVTGFVIPQARNGEDALKILKTVIRARIQIHNQRGTGQQKSMGDDSVPKLREYMRSLKRPWRIAGGNRTHNEKKAVKRSGQPVIRIDELHLPVHAGFWLKDILTGKELCNFPTKDSDGSTR